LLESSYFSNRKILNMPDKYLRLREHIKKLFKDNRRAFVYLRVHCLPARGGIRISQTVARRLMVQAGLVITGNKKKKYSSYLGESQPAPDNLFKRNFHADAPKVKWVTDISEFAIPARTVYLPQWACAGQPVRTVNRILLKPFCACDGQIHRHIWILLQSVLRASNRPE